MSNGEENFIKIDEVIQKAKERGVDFGNANPRSRLRYYAKLDLLPPAERKVFDGNQPTGAYPEEVVNLLVEIDEEVKQGKTIKEVAEEKNGQKESQQESQQEKVEEVQKKKITEEQSVKSKEEKESEEEAENTQRAEVSYQAPPFTLIPTYQRETSEKNEEQQEPRVRRINPKVFSFLTVSLKFASLALLVAAFGYTLGSGIVGEKIPSGLTASLLAQPLEQTTEQSDMGTDFSSAGQQLFTPTPDPYLTINVETDINAPLNLKSTTTPTLSFHEGDFEGTLTTAGLTANRNYKLPDQSGTVCLSTGNCFVRGRVTSPGGTEGQLARFSGSNTIIDSSIRDLYEGETLMTITEEGSLQLAAAEGEDASILESGDSPLRIEADNNLGLSINSDGEVGIGKSDPDYQLDVEGKIQASGDICTDKSGGKCLSEVSGGANPLLTTGGNVSGSGNSGSLALWKGSSQIKNSILYESNNKIGVGNESPSSVLDVSGTLTTEGFKMPTNATSNYVLTATSSGVGTWEPLPVTRPAGNLGQTLRHDGSTWVTNSFLTNLGDSIGIGTSSPSSTLTVVGTTTAFGNNILTAASSDLTDNSAIDSPLVTLRGYYDATSSTTSIDTASTQFSFQNVTGYNSGNGSYRLGLFNNNDELFSFQDGGQLGIGTTSPSETLTVAGSGLFEGPLTLSTSSLPQLVLRNGTNSLKFKTATNSTKIVSAQNMTINSLTGEVSMGDDVNLLNATNATVSAATFISNINDATVRSSDEYILRASVPIYPYSMPAQTASTSYVRVSKQFSTTTSLASTTPDVISGATRTYAFLINYSDNISSSQTSDWRVYRSDAATTSQSFNVSGQGLSDSELNEGSPHLTDFYDLPDNDWQLEVNSGGDKVRVFNILLLVYDKVE